MAVSVNGADDDVDYQLLSYYRQVSASIMQSDFVDVQKVVLDSSINSSGSDNMILDTLDTLLSNPQPSNLGELKPLPTFTEYTEQLSIKGVQEHPMISQRLPEENNNGEIAASLSCNASSNEAGNVEFRYTDPDFLSKICDERGQLNGDSLTGIKAKIAQYDISTLIGSIIADATVANNDQEGLSYLHTTTKKSSTGWKKQQKIQNLRLLGKQKPVSRGIIFNRESLHQCNVNLRTPTGPKPFLCEICAKTFRQEPHLMKHQQLHKSIK